MVIIQGARSSQESNSVDNRMFTPCVGLNHKTSKWLKQAAEWLSQSANGGPFDLTDTTTLLAK